MKTDSPHVTQRHSLTNISKTFNFSFQKGDKMFKHNRNGLQLYWKEHYSQTNSG